MDTVVENVVIVGSGPAGYTAAIYAARAGLKPIIIEGPVPGGQLMDTTDVENFPGYKDGILGPELMEDLKNQSLRFGTRIYSGLVTKIVQSGDVFTVEYTDGFIETKAIIVSTGAKAKWLGLDSEKKLYGKGVSACATCDGFFFRDQDVVVIGGGDTACEEALYLSNICKSVTMLIRSNNMVASKIMQERVVNKENIKVLYNTHVTKFVGEEQLDFIETNNGDIVVSGAFIAIGHKPNTDPFRGLLDLDEDGYIITKSKSSETNVEGIFACGDVQDKIYRQAVTAAGSGCMAALDCERWLSKKGNL